MMPRNWLSARRGEAGGRFVCALSGSAQAGGMEGMETGKMGNPGESRPLEKGIGARSGPRSPTEYSAHSELWW